MGLFDGSGKAGACSRIGVGDAHLAEAWATHAVGGLGAHGPPVLRVGEWVVAVRIAMAPAIDRDSEDVLGGGGGGPEDDWTSLAWLVLLVLEREDVVDSDRWAGVEPSWGFLLLLSSRLSSSSGSLLSPELHSSLTLSLSLWRAMSASSS